VVIDPESKDINLFDESLPADGTLLISNEVRTNFKALDRVNELRPVLGSAPNLPAGGTLLNLYVSPGNYAADSQSTKYWAGGFTPDYGTVDWPEIAIGDLYKFRTDAIVINTSGILMVVTGTAVTYPTIATPPVYPSDTVPIVEITLQRVNIPGSGITDFQDLYPNPYSWGPSILRDVRPMFVLSAAGFGINPKEEILTATSGQILFTLLTISYTVGSSEINVYVGGVRKALSDDYTEVGFPGTASNQIQFNTGLPLNEKVLVYKVGAASAHRLSDLDDMNVDLANAIIDPDSIRTTPYVGPLFPHNAFIANSNNPFVTLADLKYGAGLIPFGVEHDSTTGVHGPKVTITQTAVDNALVVLKSNTDAGAAVVIANLGSAPGLAIAQVGAAPGILLQQTGSSDALQISYVSTVASAAPVSILRVVSTAREPLITLRDNLVGGVGANISVSSHELTFADELNTRRFVFDVRSASLLLQNGGSNNHLTVLKTSGGAGRSIEVSHSGTDSAVRINHNSTSAALVIYNTGSNTIQTVKGTVTTTLDPLWTTGTGIPPPLPSNADHLHTHLTNGLNSGTGIALVELNDVDANLDGAIRDTSILRLPATAANPLATIDDVDTRTAITKSGTYSGNGTSQTITLGFQPDWAQVYDDTDNTQSGVYVAQSGTGRFFRIAGTANVSVVPTGILVSGTNAAINKVGDTYCYIAFKSTP